MDSFLDTLDDAEKPMGQLELPDQDETSFLDTLDDEGAEETPLSVEDDRPKISAYEPTAFDKMRNIFRDPGKEAAKATLAMVDSEIFKIRPSQAYQYRNGIDRISKSDRNVGMEREALGKMVLDFQKSPSWKKLPGEVLGAASGTISGAATFIKGAIEAKRAGEESYKKSMAERYKSDLDKNLASGFISQDEYAEGIKNVASNIGGLSPNAVQGWIQENINTPTFEASKGVLAKIEGSTEDFSRDLLPQYIGTFAENPSFRRGFSALSSGVGSLAIAIPISIIAGPEAGAGLLSMAEAGPVYKLAIAKGKTPEVSMDLAMNTALATFFLEKFGLEKIIGSTGTKTARFLKGSLAEGSTEMTQTIVQNAIKKHGIDDTIGYCNEIIEAGIGGLVGGPAAVMFGANGETPAPVVSEVEKSLSEQGETQGKPEEKVSIDTRTTEEKAVDAIIDTSFDRVTSIEEKDIDVEIANIMSEIEKEEDVKTEEMEIGPKAQIFRDQVSQVVGEEETTAVTSILDARAKATGMTTDEYIEYHNLEVVVASASGDRLLSTGFGGVAPEISDKAELIFTDTKTIIRAFEKADVSSLVHELGHVFRRDIGGEDLAIAENWAGVVDGEWTVPAEEKFARGWENYLATGQAPTAELQGIFEKFKQWMSEIYKSIKGSSIDVEVTPEIKEVFDRLLIPADGVEALSHDTGVEALKQSAEISQTPIEGLADRNKLKVAIAKLEKLKEKDPAKRTATDIKNIRSLEAKKADIEKLISEGGKFVESLPRAKFKGAEGPASTEIELRRSIMNARKAMAKGDKAGVEKERVRFQEIVKRATARRKASATIKAVKAKITKELKTSKAKNQSGRPNGRYGADKQVSLDRMRSWVIGKDKLTKEEARLLLGDRFTKITESKTQIPNEFELLENKLLTMIGSKTPDPEFAESVLEGIKAFKFTGEMQRERGKQNRLAVIENVIDQALEIIGGVDESKKQTGDQVRASDKPLKQRIRNLLYASTGTNYIQAWDDLLDILSFNDKSSKPGESIISEFGDVHDNENAEKSGNMDFMEELQSMVMDIYGYKTTGEMTKGFDRDSVRVDLGTFRDLKDNNIQMVFTKAEARKTVMALKDESLHDTFFSENGEMHWSPEMVKAVYDMLTPQDIGFVNAQMKWYQGYYDSVNAVFREIFGVNLPNNPNYSPISREGVNKKEDAGSGDFLKDAPFRATASGQGSLKSRVANYKAISKQSDIAVLQRHVMEMEHFKAWSQKIRDLNAVFNNTEIRQAIKENFGQSVNHHIEDTIQKLARSGNEKAELYGLFDKIRIRYTQAVLPKVASLFVKQLSSIPAYADSIPVSYWTKETAKMTNPLYIKKATEELFKESVWLRSRWKQGETERDVNAAIQTDEFKAFQANPSFMNKLMFTMRVGDIGAVIIGGYAVYTYYLEETGSKKEAIRKFEKISKSTQQSSDKSMLSSVQTGNAIVKLFTSFMTTPMQYFRKEFGAIRNLHAGRISKKQFAKTMIIYHVVLPLIFQTLSELVVTGDDDDDALIPFLTGGQKRAMLVGSLNGYLIIGDLLEYIADKAIGNYTGLPSIAPYGIGRDMVKALRLFDWDDLSDEQMIEAFRGLAGASGAATKLPLKQTVDFGIGVSDTLSGEWEKGLLEMGGWSPYTAGKATGE